MFCETKGFARRPAEHSRRGIATPRRLYRAAVPMPKGRELGDVVHLTDIRGRIEHEKTPFVCLVAVCFAAYILPNSREDFLIFCRF
jgi:hypothetical protein